MPQVEYRGANIAYDHSGSGPAVVLLHGFLECRLIWETIAKKLATSRKVICIDLPGHGESECVGYAHSMDEMAKAVHAVLEQVKIKKADLIGHSMGGYVALAYAELYPDSVRSLTLYQSSALADSDERKADRNRAMAMAKQHKKRYVRSSIRALFRPVNLKKHLVQAELLIERALTFPTQGIIAALAGMRDRPNREILLTFPPYPVHFVASDKDQRIPLDGVKQQVALNAQHTLHLIKGSGHMSHIEALDETVAIFKAILRK